MRQALALVWSAAPRLLIAVATLQILAGAGTAGQVLVANRMLAVVLGERGPLTITLALPSILALAALTLAVRLAGTISQELSRLSGALVEKKAMSAVAEAASHATLVDYERPEFHNLLQRAQLSATTRPTQMVNGLTASTGALTGIVGIALALVALEPLLLALLALGVIPVWLATRRASRKLYEFTRSQTEGDRQRHYLFLLLTHRDWAAEVRAFSLAQFLQKKMMDLYDLKTRAMENLTKQRVLIGAVGASLSAALLVATMVLLIWLLSHGHLALSEAGAAAGAVVLLGERLHGFAGGSGTLYENSLYMPDFTSFLARYPSVPSGDSTAEPLTIDSGIVADRVSFCYPSRTTPALSDVTLEIKKGEVVALVGENGSGKTTLAKILASLYEPDSGSVRWDGTDMQLIEAARVHRSVAAIFQEFGRYFMTASENIALGDVSRAPEYSEIERAAARAGADRFIADLPAGYENLLGSEYYRGANISVGQWQRIALARAYYRNSPFIILDEPTASLDPKSEAALFENIRTLFSGRSVLLISHRFGSARSADRVYVLEAGRVIECGDHDELMRLNGRYAEMFRLQAAAYGLSDEVGQPD
jgi:ATP-binding cassette subfamily B protein